MSPTTPAVSRNAARVSEYASTTHCRSEKLELSERWMSGSATFTTVMSSRSMNVAVQTAISVHHLRSRAAIGGVYRSDVPARTMCRDRRLQPHDRNRRPHPPHRRVLRGGGGGEGGTGRPQRDRQVVVHLGAGGRARPPAAPPGQR